MFKKIHLVSADSTNKYGMEYFVLKAFKSLGYEVITTDYRKVSHEEVETRIKVVTGVDFLLVIKGERVSPLGIYSAKVPTVLWLQDSVYANKEAEEIIINRSWAFDVVYSFDKQEIPFYIPYAREKALVKWLPLAADPEIHDRKSLEKTIDIGFVGSLSRPRIEFINHILQYFPVQYTYSKEKYSTLVNSTKINLNMGVRPSGAQQRVFETLSMGQFLLTNNIPDDGKLFEDNIHLSYFNDNDILEKIEYYLTHDKEREKIANAGYEEVISKHKYIHRAKEIIADVEAIERIL